MARGGLFIVAWGFVRAQPGYLLSGIRLCIETMLCLGPGWSNTKTGQGQKVLVNSDKRLKSGHIE